MKRAFLVGLSLVAFSAVQAGAADIPMKAPIRAPIAAPMFSWTGCYIGGNGGWARAEHTLSTFVPTTSNMNAAAVATITTAGAATGNTDGWTAGGQIGCNWQTGVNIIGGNLVLGVEGDLNWLRINATRNTGIVTHPNGHLYQSIDTINMRWLGTARGRVGLAFGTVMLYGTGGLAVAPINVSKDFRWDFTDGCPIINTLQSCHVGGVSGTRTGWTAGGGIEWAFVPSHPGWTVKAEYLYADFGSQTYTTLNRGTIFVPVGAAAAQPANHTVSTNLHLFRVGVNFLF
jgi:outer membrane immunogenic protein